MSRSRRWFRYWPALIAATLPFNLPLPADGALLAVGYDAENSPVYSIDESTGRGTLLGNSGFPALNSLARDRGGSFFSVVNVQGRSPDLVRINPATGVASRVSTVNLGTPTVQIRALAFSREDILYAIHNTVLGAPQPDDLYRIDVATGAGTRVGSTGLSGLQALAFSPSGTLYGWEVLGTGLVTLDTASGVATDVNPANADNDRNFQSLAFGPDGALYGVVSYLHQIDPATGSSTLVGSGGYEDVRGIEYVPEPTGGLVLCLVGASLACAHRRRWIGRGD